MIKKKIKLKFKCQACGKTHYRTQRPFFDESITHCSVCKQPTLIEVKLQLKPNKSNGN